MSTDVRADLFCEICGTAGARGVGDTHLCIACEREERACQRWFDLIRESDEQDDQLDAWWNER